jgi:hypothetical protein
MSEGEIVSMFRWCGMCGVAARRRKKCVVVRAPSLPATETSVQASTCNRKLRSANNSAYMKLRDSRLQKWHRPRLCMPDQRWTMEPVAVGRGPEAVSCEWLYTTSGSCTHIKTLVGRT